MGELEQAARDLVDGANAGDENAMGTLFLVGQNARKGRPFRACVVYELAMRYAQNTGPGRASTALDLSNPEVVDPDAYPWLYRVARRGNLGPSLSWFDKLRNCNMGKEAVVTAFSLGPRLTDSRIDKCLASFSGDVAAQKVVEYGIADPDGLHLAPILDEAGEEAAEILAACHWLGACRMAARIRQCIVSGNFSACRSLREELGQPSRAELRARLA